MSSHPLPLIGISCSAGRNRAGVSQSLLNQSYTRAVRDAGGLPVIIPITTPPSQTADLMARLDGFVLSGGGDVDPRFYQDQPDDQSNDISRRRDQLEFALLEQAVRLNRPVLAICRGIQVLNVARGGSLYTHISGQLPGALKHDWFPNHPRNYHAHTVHLAAGSRLHTILDMQDIPVNSLHHQGIHRLGMGLKAVGVSPDGLVEAVEADRGPFLVGVQWHPECLLNNPGMRRLFSSFIASC